MNKVLLATLLSTVTVATVAPVALSAPPVVTSETGAKEILFRPALGSNWTLPGDRLASRNGQFITIRRGSVVRILEYRSNGIVRVSYNGLTYEITL